MGIIGSVVEFDLDGKTAGDLVELHTVSSKKDMAGISKALAKLVVKCPAEWGDPKDKDTYFKGSYYEVTKPVWFELVEQVTADAELPAGVEVAFKVDTITGEQMGRIWNIVSLDFKSKADVLSQLTIAVEGVGNKKFNPARAEDFLALDFKTFRGIWDAFVDEVNSKN